MFLKVIIFRSNIANKELQWKHPSLRSLVLLDHHRVVHTSLLQADGKHGRGSPRAWPKLPRPHCRPPDARSLLHVPFTIAHHDTSISAEQAVALPHSLANSTALSFYDLSRAKRQCPDLGEHSCTTPWDWSTMAHHDEAASWQMHDVWSQTSTSGRCR